MSAIVGIGFLIKYTLIPGQERWLKYGDNVELYMFGMDRHDWGLIHLVIGFILVGLLIVHIILHWELIACMYNRMFQKKSTNTLIMILFITICGLFIIFPFLLNPKTTKAEYGKGRQKMHNSVSKKHNSQYSNKRYY